MIHYNQKPITVTKVNGVEVTIFDTGNDNIDMVTVESFGNEWEKFSDFTDEEIRIAGDEYFDIITSDMLNKSSLVLDVGCGSGRWSKYVASRAGHVEAIDPSDAIFSATGLLRNSKNVRLSKASADNIPFPDNSFDMAISLGVLHHIPDTQKAMADCVKKVKKGGYFMVYLYYSLDNKSLFYKVLFHISNVFRVLISNLPKKIKLGVCDIIALFIYMPLVLISRMVLAINVNFKVDHIPLSYYANKSFNIIRNDTLDRFGTPLEQRFSKKEIEDMMVASGLDNIIFSDKIPFWHAVGRKK